MRLPFYALILLCGCYSSHWPSDESRVRRFEGCDDELEWTLMDVPESRGSLYHSITTRNDNVYVAHVVFGDPSLPSEGVALSTFNGIDWSQEWIEAETGDWRSTQIVAREGQLAVAYVHELQPCLAVRNVGENTWATECFEAEGGALQVELSLADERLILAWAQDRERVVLAEQEDGSFARTEFPGGGFDVHAIVADDGLHVLASSFRSDELTLFGPGGGSQQIEGQFGQLAFDANGLYVGYLGNDALLLQHPLHGTLTVADGQWVLGALHANGDACLGAVAYHLNDNHVSYWTVDAARSLASEIRFENAVVPEMDVGHDGLPHLLFRQQGPGRGGLVYARPVRR